MLILIISTGEMVHGQMLKAGEYIFSDPSHQIQYFLLRADPTPPTCDAKMDIEAEVTKRLAASNSAPAGDLDDIFASAKPTAESLRVSLTGALKDCVEKHQMYTQIKDHITPGVKVFRVMEGSFYTLFKFGAENRALILIALLTITAAFTSLGFHHICLRPPRFAMDYFMQSSSMLLTNGMMLFSSVRYLQIANASGAALTDVRTNYAWITLFAVMCLVSAYRLIRPPKADNVGGNWIRSLECVPLVATMGVMTCLYFFMIGHPSGPAIQIDKILEILSLPLALSLHIWAGMLFKQSRMVELFMNVLRPWKFSPEMLTYLILLAGGLPTAYAGVSSVFVIAAGAIIYHEIRAVGGTAQYALASTAMSGSLGVVLRPSLLVVGIAALNRQVTTTQLFYWGGWVFLLTSTMFFIASQLHRRNRHQRASIASPMVAFPAMLREMKPIIPFAIVIAAVLMFYSHALDSPFNELTAPSILPILMLAVLLYDKTSEARQGKRTSLQLQSVGAAVVSPMNQPAAVTSTPDLAYASQRTPGVKASIQVATTETVEHVGAYISLMLFTQIVSGMVEHADIMSMAPKHFPNVWLTMAFLVVAKVILGMVMEPIGAVMLVSGTLAPIAYANGIAPVNFWMMVLVAFELGYLLPPVALNQLLTRQVVGETEIERADKEVAGLSFYRRYERWILPCIVMSISLLLVAFGPLVVQRFEFLHPVLTWTTQHG